MIPNIYLSLDETLCPTRVGVAIPQYNKSKPSKYGLSFRKNIGKLRAPIHLYFILEN